jgi:hypothetical protein
MSIFFTEKCAIVGYFSEEKKLETPLHDSVDKI